MTRSETIRRARELRRRQTPAERVLWRLLRNRRLAGFKFRRQVPHGPFIVDFYCAEAALAVELDGGGHACPEREESDRRRTRDLEESGVRVIRFWNDSVLDHPQEVAEEILRRLREVVPR